VLAGQCDYLGSVPGLADDGDVGFDAQDRLEPGPDERVIVSERP